MIERKLTEDILELFDRALPRITAHHRDAIREELAMLKSRFAALPAPPIGGAANYWKAYRESQEFRVINEAEGIDEVMHGLETVAQKFGVDYTRLKRRIGLTRGNCTLLCWPPSPGSQRKPLMLTIIRLQR